MDRRKFIKSTGASFLAASLPAAALADSIKQSLELTVAAIADKSVKALVTPGIQISVWKSGIPVANVSRGFGNIETSTAVAPSTIFRAGSITKQFTAALIAKLHDERQLSVYDPLSKYLPFFKGHGEPTLLELIHHTAGFHDQESDCVSQALVTQIELAKRISEQKTLYDFPPGTSWLYSNANYILLGAVVEAVTKQTLAETAEQMMFFPLKLTDTAFDSHSDIVLRRASGYSGTGNSVKPFVNADFIPIEQTGGAGAIRSTAHDLCRWHYSLFTGDFLTENSRYAIIAPAKLKNGRPITEARFNSADNNMGETSYGFGLMLDRSTKEHGMIAMHNGFVSGFSSYLATHVPTSTTVACMCNVDPTSQLPFRMLRKAVFSNYL